VNNYAKAKERKRLESQQGKRDKFEKNDDERNISNLFLCFAMQKPLTAKKIATPKPPRLKGKTSTKLRGSSNDRSKPRQGK
jgi:hypothetical protein